ncbi:MAG: adenylate/guanylate cyclase domain-containing protein [Inquilinus sp.]|uniref:adenylate/guanylate cyclase domain-containing protein n=1 Tax=Inquilinus sp. TaxID=1932117 RepID=UPI003F32580D
MNDRGKYVIRVIEWLASDECYDSNDAAFITGLGLQLRSIGIALDRLTLHFRTLHPEFVGRRLAWSPDAAVEILDREHGDYRSETIADNPIRHVMWTEEWLTLGPKDSRFPDWRQLDVFRDRGLTELMVTPLSYAAGPASAAGFATRRLSGFTLADRDALTALVPSLRSACELRLLRRAEETLLGTYLGTATSRRVLAGHVRRGDTEMLEAALFLCDLRGFTALSDRLPGPEVLRLLNIYFDQVVPVITEAGGEILKFMGDAVLAYFHRDGDAAGACAAAFDAAKSVLARLDVASQANGVTLQAGVALHHGVVSYGNIGSGHRLDFTVVGRDVNLTSRLQGLCALTERSIVMSPAFAGYLENSNATLLGRFPLKGLAEPVDVFSVARCPNAIAAAIEGKGAVE